MDELASLKLPDLKRELKARGLPTTGTKQVLVERLLDAMATEKGHEADDTNIDDLLDEDSMLDGDESDSGSDAVPADLIASPTSTVPPTSLPSSGSPQKVQESLKRPIEQNGSAANGSSSGSPPSKKKIILNRQPVPEEAPQVLPVPNPNTPIATSKPTPEIVVKAVPTTPTGDKAVIKLGEAEATAASDKLKLRQEKFKAELPSTADVAEKFKKRAERFGVVATGATAGTKAVAEVSTPEDEAKLAKRRERFGVATAEKVDELKAKRAARFGGATTITGSSTTKPIENSAEAEEKKRLRAARFAT